MNKTTDALVMCPYYLREDRNMLGCEGIIDRTETVTKFAEKGEKLRHIRDCCMTVTGRGCALADFLNRKYGAQI